MAKSSAAPRDGYTIWSPGWNHAVGVSVGVNACPSMSTVPPSLIVTVSGVGRSGGRKP